MKKSIFAILFAIIASPSAALAEPCVSETFDVPLAGATEFETRHADVPSPQFPGLWQEGYLNGFRYTLYANGEGSVIGDQGELNWEIQVTCTDSEQECSTAITGTPPIDAEQTAEALAACLKGKTPEQTDVPPAQENPQAAESAKEQSLAVEQDAQAKEPVESEVIKETAPSPACGRAAQEDASDGIVLQRMLVAAGTDPGPIDGIVGQGTRNALVKTLGEAARKITIPEAIDKLDSLLCSRE